MQGYSRSLGAGFEDEPVWCRGRTITHQNGGYPIGGMKTKVWLIRTEGYLTTPKFTLLADRQCSVRSGRTRARRLQTANPLTIWIMNNKMSGIEVYDPK